MGWREDDELTKEIWKEYGEYLKARDIDYLDNQGFIVRIPLRNTDHSFTHVCGIRDGKIIVWDYCGSCYTGVRLAKRVAKAIKEKYPGENIVVEKYGGSFELDIIRDVEYTTIEELHKNVMAVTDIVDEGARIGYEMLGEDFDR